MSGYRGYDWVNAKERSRVSNRLEEYSEEILNVREDSGEELPEDGEAVGSEGNECEVISALRKMDGQDCCRRGHDELVKKNLQCMPVCWKLEGRYCTLRKRRKKTVEAIKGLVH